MAPRSALRARREQLGLKQKAVAVKVGCHVDTYRRWEDGRGNPRGYQRPRLAEALKGDDNEKVDIGDLLLRDDERAAQKRGTATPTGPDLHRRRHAVGTTPWGVDPETVEGLVLTSRGFRQLYGSAGPGMLLGPATGILDLLEDLAPDASDGQRHTVVSLIGQVSALIGTLYMLDVGDFARAGKYLARAARAAKDANDTELMAFSLGCRAFWAAYSGNPGDGLAFAQGALDEARRGIHPRTHGWLAAVASEMAATTGDSDLYKEEIDEAAGQLALADAALEPWVGIGVFNAPKLAAYTGGGLVRLGQYGDAQAVLTQALEALDPALKKHRATAHVDLAEAYGHGGEIDAAAGHATAALDIVAETGHDATLRRIDALHDSLRTDPTPVVRDLGQQLLAVKAMS